MPHTCMHASSPGQHASRAALCHVQVTFLRYIRQWGKKVVFVLNKVDIFERPEDVAKVTAFVENNARDLLGVDSATVLPVSARQALDAKLDAGAGASTTASLHRAGALARSAATRLLGHTPILGQAAA